MSVKSRIKGLLPTTLLGRSLLILVLPIFLIQAITIYMFFDRHWQKMGDRLAYAIAGEIAMVADEIERNDADERVEAIQAGTRVLDFRITYARNAQLSVMRKDRRNWLYQSIRGNFITDTLAHAFDQQLGRPYNIRVDRDEKWVVVSVQLQNGVLKASVPERRIFSSSGYVVLLWMAVSSIILLFIATLFMRNQIRPIRRLAIAAERFGKGREVPFFKAEGAYEVRQAATAFMGMRDRLARQIQQRTAMLAGVSHDLRTPITRMKLQLSMMGNASEIRDLKNDVADMERMIDAYLQFARGEGQEEPVRTDLKTLIEQAVSPLNRENEWVKVDVPEGISLVIRPIALERCIGNLLGNALKYGKNAWISAKRFDGNVEICVDDDGPGIPPEQYEDVFKPFFRGENSRNAKTGGVGLGLPIVQDIVLTHGGRIWLDKSPKGGLRVVIDLPV